MYIRIYMNNIFKNGIATAALLLTIALFGMDMNTGTNILSPNMQEIIKNNIRDLLLKKEIKNLGITCKDLSKLLLEPMPDDLYKKLFKENLAIECVFLTSMNKQDHEAVEYILKKKRNCTFSGIIRLHLGFKEFSHSVDNGFHGLYQMVTARTVISRIPDQNQCISTIFEKYKYAMDVFSSDEHKMIFSDNILYDLIIAACSKKYNLVKSLLNSEKQKIFNQNDSDRWNNSIPLVLFAMIRNHDVTGLSILMQDESYCKYIKNHSYKILSQAIDLEINSEKIKSLLDFLILLDFNINAGNPERNGTTIADSFIDKKRYLVNHCSIWNFHKNWTNANPMCQNCINSGTNYDDEILRLLIKKGAKTKAQLRAIANYNNCLNPINNNNCLIQ